MNRILIVHPNLEMTGVIQNLLNELRECEGYDFTVFQTQSRANAEKEAATKPFDLAITALEIAADNRSPMGAGEERKLGMELIRTLQSKMPATRAIVVTGNVTRAGDLDISAPEGSVVSAHEGAAFDDELKSAVKKLLGPPQPRRGVVSFFLSKDKGCHAQLQEVGYESTTWPLEIEEDVFNRLVRDSKVHVHDSDWELEFMGVGEDLAKALFYDAPDNIQFYGKLISFIDRVHIENIKVRFTTDATFHPLAVEAFKEKGHKDYLMLQTVIYRALEPSGYESPRPALFTDETTIKEPLNFLIIASDVPVGAKANVDDKPIEPLKNLKWEVSDIANQLSTSKKEKNVGEVRAVAPADVPINGSFRQLVQDTLEKAKWHVVHYVGHTHYDAGKRVGYMFFPHPYDAKQVDQVKIEDFARWLGKADTRFVFLSSCSSGGHDFIYQLAKEQVPAIMGFLWEVRDASAHEYAKFFYKFLLEQRSLELACLHAKRKMHADHPEDPIWASPVLVMQSRSQQLR